MLRANQSASYLTKFLLNSIYIYGSKLIYYFFEGVH
jgi:hypothetical protein